MMDVMRCDLCNGEIDEYNFIEIVTEEDIYDFHFECEREGRRKFNLEIL